MVTTSVWGDIVRSAVGDLAEVEAIMPVGADPHDFAPSARQAEATEDADLVVANGLGPKVPQPATAWRVSSAERFRDHINPRVSSMRHERTARLLDTGG